MSRVFWDANLFIYLLEEYGPFTQMTAELRQRMLHRGDQLLTSTMALGEVLTKPMSRTGDMRWRKYEETIASVAVVLPFGMAEARAYAAIRQDKSIKQPDAIQLACAAVAKVDLFITNDQRLQSKRVEGIQFITSLDRAPI